MYDKIENKFKFKKLFMCADFLTSPSLQRVSEYMHRAP